MSPDNIKALRLFYGLTQEQFARLIGTTTVTVNRWENRKSVPSNPFLKEMKLLLANYGSYKNRFSLIENIRSSLLDDCYNNVIDKNITQHPNPTN